MILRDYQRDAIDGVYTWFEGNAGNPLVVVPTGGGKSVIAAAMIREVVEALPEERIVVVTHVKELIEQNSSTLVKVWPEGQCRIGINSAGLGERDTRSQVIFAGVQSIYTSAAAIGHVDLIVVDEAHLIPPKGWGMYQQLLSGLRGINPQVKMIGLTATPYRTDTGSLDEGDTRLFHGIAYECSIPKMIEDGWLSPVTNQGVYAEIDTSNVKLRGGEFRKDELEEAATAGDLVERSVEEMVLRGTDRKAWLVFACSVQHAKDIAAQLELHEIKVATVFGETPAVERDQILVDFKAGKLRCIVNVNVLTTGFDAPNVDLISLMRPTKSPGLFVQMVGRGLRIAEGKTDCLVLDYGTNVLRHGPIDNVRPTQPGTGEGDAPMKKCPKCLALVYSGTTICPSCGHEFEMARGVPDHDLVPDEDSVILSGDGTKLQRWPVKSVVVQRHTKPGKPDSMKVTYVCGPKRMVSEWVCFEHEGFAAKKAAQWWRARCGQDPVPATISDALARVKLDEILDAQTITVDKRGRYPEIKGVTFRDAPEQAEPETEPEPVIDYDDIPF